MRLVSCWHTKFSKNNDTLFCLLSLMNHFCDSITPPRKIVFYGEKETLSHILLTQAFGLLRGIIFIIRSLDLYILDKQHLNIFSV